MNERVSRTLLLIEAVIFLAPVAAITALYGLSLIPNGGVVDEPPAEASSADPRTV